MRIAHIADTHLGFQRWGYPDKDGFNLRLLTSGLLPEWMR